MCVFLATAMSLSDPPPPLFSFFLAFFLSLLAETMMMSIRRPIPASDRSAQGVDCFLASALSLPSGLRNCTLELRARPSAEDERERVLELGCSKRQARSERKRETERPSVCVCVRAVNLSP